MDPAGSGLTAMFEQEREYILRFLRARCGDGPEAEDVLQDLWIKIGDLSTGPIANGRAYLMRMANNLLIDRRRSQMRAMQRDRDWLGDDAGKEPEMRPDTAQLADEALAQSEEAEILHRAIAELPPGARRALQLFRFEEHSQAEIAEIMGISRSGVEKHLALAMKHLRNALCDCGAFAAVTSNEVKDARGASSVKEQGR